MPSRCGSRRRCASRAVPTVSAASPRRRTAIATCKACGGHLFTDHPQWSLVDVYAAVIPDFPYKAGVHVHYQESRLPLRDGLPKMRDLPKEMGGSGAVLAE